MGVYKVHCNRAFKGVFVDVRSTQLNVAHKKKLNILITCDTFPGKQMTLKLSEAKNKAIKIWTNQSFKSKYNEKSYKLYTYKFEADEI